MRILAITLFAGEHELDACLASVRRQTLAPAEHLVFKHLTKRQAHDKLFGTFMDRRDEFDLLVKIDADMVLRSDHLLQTIADRFEQDPAMGVLAIKVHDFFTDHLMHGLNTYRNTLRWSADGDPVFTDRFAYDKSTHRNAHDLAPAADHCPDPGLFQAFHFGVHRGVKAVVGRDRAMHDAAYLRHREIERTWRHFRRNPDRRLGLAAVGGELAMQGRVGPDQLDYDDPGVHALFKQYKEASADELARAIQALRRADHGRLPWLIRHEVRRGVDRTLPWRCLAPLPVRKAASISARKLARGDYFHPRKTPGRR